MLDVFGSLGLDSSMSYTDLAWKLFLLGTVAAPFIYILNTVYKAFFHPLARFPGPKLAAITNYPYSKSYLGGRQPWDILELHERYGPVVRVAPNELSFNTSQAWTDIHGVRKGRVNCFLKSNFYDGANFADQAHSIVSERDPEKHKLMRKFLSRALSDTSLKEQEQIIGDIIELFVERVGEEGVVDVAKWFNLLTSDIVAMLAFGENFNGVETGETHFWIKDVLGSMTQLNILDTVKRFPTIGTVWVILHPRWVSRLLAAAKRYQQYTIDQTMKRIKEKTDRKDFMSYLLKDRGENSDIQLAAHASDLVLAGSETTAVALASLFFFLCKNPAVEQKLRSEILSTFNTYDDINATSAAGLRYLHATCLEAMRMYPPLTLGLPRLVPKGGDFVDGFFVPGGTVVTVNPFAAGMSSRNFANPTEFRPERWLDPEKATDILDASRPFSYGPRACLGRSLAWVEMNVTVSRLVFRYEFEMLNKDVDWHRDSEMHLLWKKPEILVKFTERRV